MISNWLLDNVDIDIPKNDLFMPVPTLNSHNSEQQPGVGAAMIESRRYYKANREWIKGTMLDPAYKLWKKDAEIEASMEQNNEN